MMTRTFTWLLWRARPRNPAPADRALPDVPGREGEACQPVLGPQPRSSTVGVEMVRSLALMLMAASLATLVLATHKLILTWVGDDLFLAWAALWCVLLSALLLLSRLITVLAQRVLVSLDSWVWQLARQRAAKRLRSTLR